MAQGLAIFRRRAKLYTSSEHYATLYQNSFRSVDLTYISKQQYATNKARKQQQEKKTQTTMCIPVLELDLNLTINTDSLILQMLRKSLLGPTQNQAGAGALRTGPVCSPATWPQR